MALKSFVGSKKARPRNLHPAPLELSRLTARQARRPHGANGRNSYVSPPGTRACSKLCEVRPSVGVLFHVIGELRAVALDSRVAAFVSEKWYSYAWGAYGLKPSGNWTSRPYEKINPTRVLRFGVNIIVFALTQEGSITHRLMESVR